MPSNNTNGIELLPVDFNCFIDEIELPQTQNTHLTFFYFGVLIPSYKFEVENQIKELLSDLGQKKFHSHKTYRIPANKAICQKLTAIIIANNLNIICFHFQKRWLDDASLAILKTVEFPQMLAFKNDNYRSQAWLLFIHVLNSYLSNNYGNQKTRLIFDKDWLRKNQMVVHDGHVLKALAETFSSTQKTTPALALADHVGYLFQKLKKVTYLEDKTIKIKPLVHTDEIAKNAVLLFRYLLTNRLFHKLDLSEWLTQEKAK